MEARLKSCLIATTRTGNHENSGIFQVINIYSMSLNFIGILL